MFSGKLFFFFLVNFHTSIRIFTLIKDKKGQEKNKLSMSQEALCMKVCIEMPESE